MKRFGLLLYFGIVIAGGAYIVSANRGPDVKLVAARTLPANHLLEPDDLQLKVDGRQYLPRPLKKGDTVDSGEIRMLGDVVTSVGQIPIPLTIGRDAVLSGDIDRGDVIFLCPMNVQAVVRAAFCGDPVADCIVIVAAAVAETNQLKKAGQEISVRSGDTCE